MVRALPLPSINIRRHAATDRGRCIARRISHKIDGSRFPLGYESLNIALTEVALVTRRQRFILLIGFTLAVNAVVLAQEDIRLRLAQKKNEGAIAAFSVGPEKGSDIGYNELLLARPTLRPPRTSIRKTLTGSTLVKC